MKDFLNNSDFSCNQCFVIFWLAQVHNCSSIIFRLFSKVNVYIFLVSRQVGQNTLSFIVPAQVCNIHTTKLHSWRWVKNQYSPNSGTSLLLPVKIISVRKNDNNVNLTVHQATCFTWNENKPKMCWFFKNLKLKYMWTCLVTCLF